MSARRYDPSPARARAIRHAREQAHMSRYDLAAALGVGEATVRRWEAAVNDPGPDVTWRIAVATRVRVSSLLMPRWDSGASGWPVERSAA